MLQLIALFLGLGSWALLLFCIFARKSNNSKRRCQCRILSLLLCNVALYLPYLSQHLEFKSKDYDSLIDCVSTYHLSAFALLIVNLFLNVILAVMNRKRNKL